MPVKQNPAYLPPTLLVQCGRLSSYRKPQAMLVEEKSRSVETVEKEPPFAIIRSG